MKALKHRNMKKKEYYTFMFLPGPNERVRTLSISKSIIKSTFLSIAAVLVLSLYLVYEYNDVKDKVWELQSMREELMQQKVQVQDFALNLLDYKRQMFLLRDLDTKLRRAISLGPRDRVQQFLGIGGPDELGLHNLTSMGEKKQAEALKEMRQELAHARFPARSACLASDRFQAAYATPAPRHHRGGCN